MLLIAKVALVTGGAQGIGKGIAMVFSEEGAQVVICDKNEALAKETAEEIGKITGRPLTSIYADVAIKAQVDLAVGKVLDTYGRIDILVNNAGVEIFHPFLEIPEEIWDLHYNVSLLAKWQKGYTPEKKSSGAIEMLKPESDVQIPDETIKVAKAAFPNGNIYLTLRDSLGAVFQDEDFKELYPTHGQPAESPGRLALISEVGHECITLMISLIYGKRALPITWLVVKAGKDIWRSGSIWIY